MTTLTDRIDQSVAAFFSALQPRDVSAGGMVKYKWTGDGGIAEASPYWENSVRAARFENTLQEGILYRPAIVDDVCEKISQCLSSSVGKGLMIKGPQGIGKSHTLVNVVRKLSLAGDCLVTFFPDCQHWITGFNFLDTICASFGSKMKEFGVDGFDPRGSDASFVQAFVGAVDSALEKQGKQWVFVFDQINKLFVKPENKDARDASGLAFPFYFVQAVIKKNRITSVISASSNNELSYKERHEGFIEFEHRIDMTGLEILEAFSAGTSNDVNMEDSKQSHGESNTLAMGAANGTGIAAEDGGHDENSDGSAIGLINGLCVDEIIRVSGGVPLYAKGYIDNPRGFQSEVNASVYDSIKGLRKSGDWDIVLESIVSALLGTTSSAQQYDKKFLRREPANESGTWWNYFPLFSAVVVAYKEYLWKELMEYVETNEATLLEVCRNPATTNDTRGRLFEIIAIRRCQTRGACVHIDNQPLEVSPGFKHVPGRAFPTDLTPDSTNYNYIPLDPNFPSIDWIWVCGRRVIGVQTHVSIHDDVSSAFWGLCREAGWFTKFDKVHLIYLSPEDATVELVRTRFEPPDFTVRQTRSSRNVDVDSGRVFQVWRHGFSRSSVSCLTDLQWPDGCSLP